MATASPRAAFTVVVSWSARRRSVFGGLPNFSATTGFGQQGGGGVLGDWYEAQVSMLEQLVGRLEWP